MIEFGNFYQLIAKNHFPLAGNPACAKIAAWQRDQQHGLLSEVGPAPRVSA